MVFTLYSAARLGRYRFHLSEYPRLPVEEGSKETGYQATRPMSWAEEDRFRERTMGERVYGRLKDEFGAREVRVRGARKVMAHLMFGVLALTADQILKLVV
jgi:hypothetical protein